jgi:hypothetical protein
MLTNDHDADWGYSGAHAIAEHLKQIEEDTGEEMELDLVAIRCDFARHDSLSDWSQHYFYENDMASSLGFDDDDTDDEKNEKIREFIRDHGTLIEFNGGIIVSQF